MRNYTITINDEAYAVAAEEGAVPGIAAAPAAPVATPTAPAAPVAAPAPAAVPAGIVGSASVSAPMPGKVVAVRTVAGQAVKRDDVILILEAMKMENNIVVPQDGTIVSINASTGGSVESGTVSTTLNQLKR